MSLVSGDNVPQTVMTAFGKVLDPSVPKENRIIEYNKYGIPEVKAGPQNETDMDKYNKLDAADLDKIGAAIVKDIVEKNKTIEPKLEESMNKPDPKLQDGEMLISTINCGIVCKPKEVRIEDKFFVIILTKEDSQKFILYPATKLHLTFKNVNGKDSEFNIYYSGIKFEYNSDIFIVFHEINNTEF